MKISHLPKVSSQINKFNHRYKAKTQKICRKKKQLRVSYKMCNNTKCKKCRRKSGQKSRLNKSNNDSNNLLLNL